MRLIAIGDIHGHLAPLQRLIALLDLQPGDQLVFLGDYVDKGPDVAGTLDALIALDHQHDCVFLRGNHDQMLLEAYRDETKGPVWECLAGAEPLRSYGDGPALEVLRRVPPEHIHFLETQCRDYWETGDWIFVHAGISPHTAPADEDIMRLQWSSLNLAAPHQSGRTVICGHSSQKTGTIADLGHTLCIDTAITSGGYLTALSLSDYSWIQTTTDGTSRTGQLRLHG